MVSKYYNILINMTVVQLSYFNVHIGHLKKNSCFFAHWFFLCWRDNIFIINLLKMVIFGRIGLKMVKNVITARRPFWFVTLNNIYGPYLVRFANLSGEPFSAYDWISGTISNYKFVLGWMSLVLYFLRRNIYKLRTMDRKTLVRLYGVLNKKLAYMKSKHIVNIKLARHYDRWGRTYYQRRYRWFKKSEGYRRFSSRSINNFFKTSIRGEQHTITKLITFRLGATRRLFKNPKVRLKTKRYFRLRYRKKLRLRIKKRYLRYLFFLMRKMKFGKKENKYFGEEFLPIIEIKNYFRKYFYRYRQNIKKKIKNTTYYSKTYKKRLKLTYKELKYRRNEKIWWIFFIFKGIFFFE